MSVLPTPRLIGPVPGLFEAKTINLIIGTSKASKTHFLLNQLENYSTGSGFLNYSHHPNQPPAQLGMIIAAGTQGKVEETLVKFPFLSEHTNFPMEAFRPAEDKSDYDNLCAAYDRLNSYIPPEKRPVKLLVVKGFQDLMTSGKHHEIKPVKDFCRSMHLFCDTKNVTILGMVNTGKARTYESYPQLADRIPGANCWASEMDTLIGIERIKLCRDPELRPSTRRIIVQVSWGPDVVHWGKFLEDGRMDVSPDYIPIDDVSATDQALLEKLEKAKPGAIFKTKDFARWATECKVDPKTVTRWANDMIKQGLLKREGLTNKTRYIKSVPQ